MLGIILTRPISRSGTHAEDDTQVSLYTSVCAANSRVSRVMGEMTPYLMLGRAAKFIAEDQDMMFVARCTWGNAGIIFISLKRLDGACAHQNEMKNTARWGSFDSYLGCEDGREEGLEYTGSKDMRERDSNSRRWARRAEITVERAVRERASVPTDREGV